jgi:hypothetical protein
MMFELTFFFLEEQGITLKMKLKKISQHEGSKSAMTITHELGHLQLMILTILKNKKQTSEAVELSTLVKTTVVTKKRAGLLMVWKKFLSHVLKTKGRSAYCPLIHVEQEVFSIYEQRANDSPTYMQMFTATQT